VAAIEIEHISFITSVDGMGVKFWTKEVQSSFDIEASNPWTTVDVYVAGFVF